MLFFVNGTVFASWVAHIPAVKARHALDDDRLGLVLLSMAVGSVLALPAAAHLIARWGSRAVAAVAAIAMCLALPLPLLAADTVALVAALAWLGACNAVLDVAMNAQAVAVEDRSGRPIMSSFHALFSTGGLAGAAAASGAMALGIRSPAHVVGVSLVCAGAILLAIPALAPSARAEGTPASVFAWPRAALAGLGLLTFCGLLAEGAVGDWSAVYLRDSLDASPALAANGFAAFSLAMAAGRFAGSALAERAGTRPLLFLSGAVATGGLAGALIIASAPAAIIGFGLVGLGIANVIPLLFSAAGRVRDVPPATALAAVATTGYAGYLAGPPAIGFAAGITSLGPALGIVAVACALIALGALGLPLDRAGPPQARGGAGSPPP